jgi:hypothetical protein
MIFYFSLGILVFVWGASLWRRFFDEGLRNTNLVRIYEYLIAKLSFLRNLRSRAGTVSERSEDERGEEQASSPRWGERSGLREKKILLFLFLFSIFLIFLLLLYQGFGQYEFWRKSEISKFLLPPYQSWVYFIGYVGWRTVAPYLVSLSAGILFFFTARELNRIYGECFFYPEELYFGMISLFLAGHPGWLFYSVLIIIIYLAIHLISLLITHYSLQRLSLYYLWLPTAIFVIIIQKWLQTLPFWQALKF